MKADAMLTESTTSLRAPSGNVDLSRIASARGVRGPRAVRGGRGAWGGAPLQ